MNHACECGHQPEDHYATTGQCEFYDDTEDWPCTCPRYQWGGDN